MSYGIFRSVEKSLMSAKDHFTVVCFVTWPLIDSEAGGGPILTSLLMLCKSSCCYANYWPGT